MKIALIGYSGAGKSTLAKALGKRWNCPVLHLDTVNFLPGWQERPPEEAETMVAEFLDQDSWVIDGNYKALCFHRRMAEADFIIACQLPWYTCLRQAWGRYRSNKRHHMVRDCIAAGCDDKFDWEFFWWIVRDGRNKEKQNWYQEIRDTYGEKVLTCCSRGEMDRVPDMIAGKVK